MDFSFTKADRLLKRADFLRLSQSGKKIQNRYFLAFVCPGPADRTRFGVTVTRKVGNAVTRNRIKRLCREHFRLNKHTITGNWDINIIAKKPSADLSTDPFFSALQNIFDKLPVDDH
ncbi:MAG: ribonuclease P protein component [Thermodesulfobacteriota bacterium]